MKTIQKLLIVLLALGAVACSSQTSDPYAGDHSSNNGGTDPDPTPSPAPGNYSAKCNNFSSSQGNLVGKVNAFYMNGNLNTDFVRIRLTGIPTNFGNTDDLFIEFYRWRVTPSGVVEQDPTPLRFRLENPYTYEPVGGWFGPNGSQNVGFNKAALFAATNSTSLSKLTELNFLIQGTDAGLGYQVLRIALTHSSGGTTSNQGFGDMLIPLFDSNPNRYRDTHSNMSVLHSLHPNWTRRTEGWSNDQFLAFTNQYCFSL